MPYEYHYQRRVEFGDTDLAGIIHFSNYFRYMEAAEHAFYLSLGFSVHALLRGQLVTWPRVKAECSYSKPLHFEDLVHIQLLVAEKRRKAIRYLFIFRVEREGVLVEVARGSVTVVCVSRDPETNAFRSMRIPEEIDSIVEVAPAELLERTDASVAKT
jgi:YbgC/YbaW family acyl-CoA thioester hydrolase